MDAFLTRLFAIFFVMVCFNTFAQEDDDFEDFDPSMFEEAGSGITSYCTNKVFAQSPTALVSLGFDYQGASTITSGMFNNYPMEDVEISSASGFRLQSNVPIISKNNILVNWSLNFVNFGYQLENDNITGPLTETLREYDLNWLNTGITVFKPLDDKKYLIFQVAAEMNGDYTFNDLPSSSQVRLPAAFIYGKRSNDRTMWGVGVSRTYLGGALNVLPVIYYYKTFKNEKWGLEALFPGRAQLRYRWNSRSVALFGYQVEGASYRLSNFNTVVDDPNIRQYDDIELRRSEIRLGLTLNKGFNDFIWVSFQTGVRLNNQFNADEGDFFRGFDDSDYFMENDLSTTFYAQIAISMVSP